MQCPGVNDASMRGDTASNSSRQLMTDQAEVESQSPAHARQSLADAGRSPADAGWSLADAGQSLEDTRQYMQHRPQRQAGIAASLPVPLLGSLLASRQH